MPFDAQRLLALLPAIYRRRDAEVGGPLATLLEILARQLSVLEADVEQLYDDAFVETSAPWVLPYLADLVGLEGLAEGGLALTPRAEVANTVAYRRRKGLAATLEQLARDVTGWPTRVVEFFELLATTQHMQHVRLESQALLDLRDAARLEWLDTAFERRARHLLPPPPDPCGRVQVPPQPPADIPHTVDVRRIGSRRGRYNIPSVGVFVWRLLAMPRTHIQPEADPSDPTRRFRFSPLGIDLPLFSHPQTEDDITHLAEPVNVPMRISRRMLANHPASYYPVSLQLATQIGDAIEAIPLERVRICDLTDWVHAPPPDGFAIDPVLGRIKAAEPQDALVVSCHHGFSAELGGGEYHRGIDDDATLTVHPTRVDAHPSVAAALAALGGSAGVIEAVDPGPFVGPLDLVINAFVDAATLEVRAEEQRQTHLRLGEGDGAMRILGDGTVILDGLLISGGPLVVPATRPDGAANRIERLELRHCTLVPGGGVPDGSGGFAPGAVTSLRVEIPDIEVVLIDCVVGGLRMHARSQIRLTRCIVDAGEAAAIALAGIESAAPAGHAWIESTTVRGRVRVTAFERISNSILDARLPADADPDAWPVSVHATRRQIGCARFSFAPWSARLPRRFRCQPASAASVNRVRPIFESVRYGAPEYMQLAEVCPDELRTGAADASEMGAFHALSQPLKERYLLGRLSEHLRFGLEAGIFHAT